MAERRGKTVASLPAVAAKPGVFAWLNNGPEAGTNSWLVYNRISGPLRHSTTGLLVHVGYDGWWLKVRACWAALCRAVLHRAALECVLRCAGACDALPSCIV